MNMNDLLNKVKTFAQANKALLIKTGSALVGALVGATIASVVLANEEDSEMLEEELGGE